MTLTMAELDDFLSSHVTNTDENTLIWLVKYLLDKLTDQEASIVTINNNINTINTNIIAIDSKLGDIKTAVEGTLNVTIV